MRPAKRTGVLEFEECESMTGGNGDRCRDYKSTAASLLKHQTQTAPEKTRFGSRTMSHVDVKNIKPTSFEEEHFDEYEFYNLSDKYTEGAARKEKDHRETEEHGEERLTEIESDGFSGIDVLSL
uniref:Uncharacterized protein n=1 Tax=Knipowitschia caucasica TaxID=637954 RepID=A0AAV2KI38_KNICA